ncbi:head GIN domain-containing protein [Chryseobacterium koreense]|uniref:Putative auto-transporter adhesin head GIN domain-containing protein n=1 Tax=Chryseobacterium koreense CCUG 49689 TaxID=1304281 RepID=A0A0J7LPN2_9FLAO|nr:head GIN domain-containing protein [Chryseobacterium koreense]KMQ71025.1 hypothetical protein ACM44_08725 [Chryseobacterium koreense CCUG 49689]MBB5332895.1 cytoskeletal protein CcmA (bactofilin family) [Chryseobacterium koreense]
MKTLPLLAICAASFLSCNIKSDGGFPLNIIPKEGKGPITEKEYKMDFDEIKVAQSIKAEVFKANQEKVVIAAPSDLMDDILVENNGGNLYIHFKPGINISSRNVTARIYAKDFSALKASSSADIIVRDQFTQDRTDIQVSSSGTVKGDLEANEMSIDVSSSGTFSGKIWAVNLKSGVSSSGDVVISGKAKNANLRASSSGTIQATNLIAENADVQASSSGDVSLSVSNSLKASASSSGDIVISRKGAVNVLSKSESSGGSVRIN